MLALIVAAAAAFSVPVVREQLRESFTRMPDTYQELYFTRAPAVQGDVAVVPVSLRDHSEGTHTYRVRVSLRTADGTVTASAVTSLTPHPDATAQVRLRPFHGPATVYVELLGHSQTVHFRLTSPAGATRPATPASPTSQRSPDTKGTP